MEVVTTAIEEIDEFSAVVRVSLCDESGNSLGEAWLCAGVPAYLVGTAKAAANWHGLESVWPFSDCLENWCPDGLREDPQAVLDASWEAALGAWRASESEAQ